MIFISYKDSKSLNITPFGGLAGQMWAAGRQKVGFTPQLIRHVSPNWLKINFSARERLPEEAKFQCNQLGEAYAKEHAKNT
eukprot:1156155-Pelagomonas_calceolata.AAC.4